MKPIYFPEQNTQLNPNPEGHGNYVVESLYTWTNGEQVISCWKMSWKERFYALLFGKVWLAVLSGKTSPPVYLQSSNKYL